MKNKTNYLPLISILIPVHNSENDFNSSIKTVLNQTYQNLEIIFHNDASTDNTEKILKELSKNDSRIRYINSYPNVGIGISRDKLIKEAKGEFVFFIDSDDDLANPKIIEKAAKHLKNNLDILSTQFKYKFDYKLGKPIINNMVKSLKIKPTAIQYYSETTIFSWGHFFRLNFLKEANANFGKIKNYEDIAEMGNLFSKCKNFKKINLYSIIYHRKNNSLSCFDQNYQNKIIQINKAYELNVKIISSNLKNNLSFNDLNKIINNVFMEHLSLISVYYLNIKNKDLKKEFKSFINNIYLEILDIYQDFDIKIKYHHISDLPIFLVKFLFKKN